MTTPQKSKKSPRERREEVEREREFWEQRSRDPRLKGPFPGRIAPLIEDEQ